MKYYLAVDIGASSGRHILGSLQNGKLVLEEIYRFENSLVNENGDLFWDVASLSENVIAGLKKANELGKIPTSVAIDTWGVDYVLLKKDLSPILPVYAYRDKRTEESAKKVENIIPFSELYSETGIQKQLFNTVFQLYDDLEKGRLEKAEHFLMMPEYLSFVLTGETKNEYTNASTTGMLDAEKFTWDEKIIKTLGYPEKLFKALSMPSTLMGRFRKEIADTVGYDAKVVFCASHDTGSAVAAVPLDDESLYVSSGTWSLIGTENKEAILSKEAMEKNFTNEGGIDKRFRLLKNYMGMWLFQNIRKDLGKKLTYDEMMKLAMDCGKYYYFDVNDPRLTAPDNMIEAIKNVIGKDITLAEVLNSTYYSLASSYRNAVEEIEKISDKKIGKIFIVGGGSKDEYLNSLTVAYTGKRVFTGLSEATATGNLISQMIEDKVFANLTEARKCVFDSFSLKEIKDVKI